MPIKLRLFEFWKQQEIEQGRIISISEVSRSTGISRDTLTRLRADKTSRPDLELLGKLCHFFKVPPGPVPFVVWEED